MKTLKLIGLFCLTIAFGITLNAQTSQVRNVKNFSVIDVSEGIKVELTFGKKEFVEVTTDEDLIDNVMTEVDGNRLRIYIKGKNSWFRNKKVIVKVTATKVNGLEASSGSSIYGQNMVESNDLDMSVSSGASLKVMFKSPKASCDASSGANARLKGVAKYFSADASSGSSISAHEVKAVKVNADVSSGASISVHAEDELVADASSGGSIRYDGSPKIKNFDKSSGGSVKAK